jgi:hypothetical protein
VSRSRCLGRSLIIILAGLVILCIVISVPVWMLQTNPPVVQEPPWDSPQTRALAQRACFDCHSNETTWPIYARIPPVSWLVTQDVVRGRSHLNFSEWGVAQARGGEGGGRGSRQIGEVITNGSMPPGIYLPMHPSAGLSDAEKQQLIQGLQASLK